MATYHNGVNGPFRGKIGKAHGSSRRGTNYIKGSYKKRTKKVSEPELANRSKFKTAQLWLKPILAFVREGFKNHTRTSQGFTSALSYLLLNAFDGEQPNLNINPAKVKVSAGTLPCTDNVAVSYPGNNILKFSWDKEMIGGNPRDQVMLLAYDIENNFAYQTNPGQFRSAGEDTIKILMGAKTKTFHLYIAFVAVDRSRQSDSLYAGTITLSAEE